MSSRSFVRRAAAAVAGTAVVASGLMVAGPAPAAHAAETVAPNAAAAWLAGELDADGLLYGDVSKTIDFALALNEIGGHQATLDRIKVGVDAKVDTYATDGVSWSQAALFYQAVGIDPGTKAGGLIAKIEGAVDDTKGEMPYPWGGAWSQALAVRALHAAGSGEAAAATDSLIDDFKCPTGGWGYWDYPGHTSCSADPDDTADMLFALLPQKGESAKIDGAITEGIAWLKDNQKSDGGFDNYGENASSTGLAAHALALAGANGEAQSAAAWLRKHQIAGSSCDGKLSAEGGAVGFNDQVITDGRADGIDPAAAGYDWYLATAQSIVALQSAAPATGQLTVTPLFVHVSATVSLAATGLAPAENACLTVGTTSTALEGGATTAISFAAPGGAQSFPVTLIAPGRKVTASLQVLGAKKFKVKVASKLKAKKKATIKVKGLAAGESVTVKIGKKTATGVAKANGVAKVKIKVKKKGKAKVKVVGQFPDRKGKATTRVV